MKDLNSKLFASVPCTLRNLVTHASFHHIFHCYSIPMPLFLPETQPWDPVSRYAGISWLLVYSLFLLHAFRDTSGFLFPDFVNLMIHEAGHLFFSWGGHTLMILGGTLGELLVFSSRSYALSISISTASPTVSSSPPSGFSKTFSTSVRTCETPVPRAFH